MYDYAPNHYYLILKSTSTRDTRIFDIYNTGEAEDFITIENFEWPDDFTGSEFEYYAVWSRHEIEFKISPNILDTTMTVAGLNVTNQKPFKLRDVEFETGLIKKDRSNGRFLSLDLPIQHYSLN